MVLGKYLWCICYIKYRRSRSPGGKCWVSAQVMSLPTQLYLKAFFPLKHQWLHTVYLYSLTFFFWKESLDNCTCFTFQWADHFPWCFHIWVSSINTDWSVKVGWAWSFLSWRWSSTPLPSPFSPLTALRALRLQAIHTDSDQFTTKWDFWQGESEDTALERRANHQVWNRQEPGRFM